MTADIDGIALAAEGLCKRFGGNTAVDRVSIAFAKGRLHSILGPNGAGKTTLFNLLTRDLLLDSGTIRLGTTDISRLTPDRVARMGVARSYQISSVYPDMSVRENVWIAAYRARGGNPFAFWRQATSFPETGQWADACLSRLGLSEIADVSVKELSYGDQRLLDEILLADDGARDLGADAINLFFEHRYVHQPLLSWSSSAVLRGHEALPSLLRSLLPGRRHR